MTEYTLTPVELDKVERRVQAFLVKPKYALAIEKPRFTLDGLCGVFEELTGGDETSTAVTPNELANVLAAAGLEKKIAAKYSADFFAMTGQDAVIFVEFVMEWTRMQNFKVLRLLQQDYADRDIQKRVAFKCFTELLGPKVDRQNLDECFEFAKKSRSISLEDMARWYYTSNLMFKKFRQNQNIKLIINDMQGFPFDLETNRSSYPVRVIKTLIKAKTGVDTEDFDLSLDTGMGTLITLNPEHSLDESNVVDGAILKMVVADKSRGDRKQATGPKVLISVRCRDLAKNDHTSKSDPMCVIMGIKDDGSREVYGSTERVNDEHDPIFQQQVVVQTRADATLRVAVYDVDGNLYDEKDLLGEAFIQASELFRGSVVDINLTKNGEDAKNLDTGKQSFASLTCAIIEEIPVTIECENLPPKDPNSDSDPLVAVFMSDPENPDDEDAWKAIGQTESMRNVPSPTFETPIVVEKWPGHSIKLRFVVYDVDDPSHIDYDDMIGDILIDANELVSNVPLKRELEIVPEIPLEDDVLSTITVKPGDRIAYAV